MASDLRIINWQADKMTPTLNFQGLSELKPSEARHHYLPYSQTVPRKPADAPKPGEWGRINTLVITSRASSEAQTYNDLYDPEGAAPNNEMLLWVFKDYLVISQLGKQLGGKIYPSVWDQP
ncbi:hypothetical protein KUV51_18925 [Tateyamaria omphalii]|uniref:hypothetical protein n=1 Tax=Tateyamaria omphalii TaxID=299262 RepID=UPI001C9986CD|nr:hypothetical protein [Tateyamaria omphalii]MBY5935086.1 hypothetical protein [Tateyamaria omphalii]